jgi:hypothetical protein
MECAQNIITYEAMSNKAMISYSFGLLDYEKKV